MAVILENRQVADCVFCLRVSGAVLGRPGQFYMLRQPEQLDPFLSRPISLFDADAQAGTISFLYQTVGRGTHAFSALLPGQQLTAQGPYGNGFPLEQGAIVLIGGGIGIAPLYYLSKTLRMQDPARRVSAYLGFREEAYMQDAFAAVCSSLHPNIGGFVTDEVDFTQAATYYACGPAPMLRAAAGRAKQAGAKLYVSLETRFACGLGACLGCTIQMKDGTNRRVCKDGPVFLSEEVLFDGA